MLALATVLNEGATAWACSNGGGFDSFQIGNFHLWAVFKFLEKLLSVAFIIPTPLVSRMSDPFLLSVPTEIVRFTLLYGANSAHDTQI